MKTPDRKTPDRQAAKLENGSGVSTGMDLREEPPPCGTLSPAEQSLVADLVADGLSIQEKFRPEPLYKQTGKGQYESGTVEEMQQAKEKSRRSRKQ